MSNIKVLRQKIVKGWHQVTIQFFSKYYERGVLRQPQSVCSVKACFASYTIHEIF